MYTGSNRRVSGKVWVAAACLLISLAAAPAKAQVTSRPLSDFINAQHAFGTYPLTIWEDPTTNRLIYLDFAGKINEYIVAHGGTSLGTTLSGTIMERPLKDGTAEISLVLHLQNAVTYAYQDSKLVFGHTPLQIAGGADPALATINLNMKFTISAPGAPLSDLTDIIFIQQKIGFNQLTAIGQGTFRAAYGVPDGTPGFVQTTDTGVLQSHGNGGPRGDSYPVEHIDFHVQGQ
ncbi:MAG TPA: hypothetical protein VGH38_33060 [Bryobacteraceae bacterium]|jgi:hypothetical protein